MSGESLGFLIGAIILSGVTIYLGLCLFVARGKVHSTVGTIVDIFYTAGKHQYNQSMAIMSYTVDGKYYTSENRLNVFRTLKVGEELKVKYFIDKPERLFIKSHNQFIGFLVATVICAIIFTYFCFFK